MELPKTYDALITEADNLDLYTKLVAQLNKDFLYANIDLDIELDVSPNELKIIVHEVIYKLIQERFSEYLNLLYIVDVSEEKVKSLNGDDTVELSGQVTFLILLREWQKVWLRWKYS